MSELSLHQTYRRTAAGETELKGADTKILPREARTLLILIDGRQIASHLLNALDKRELFKKVGGSEQFLQLLLDLGFIEPVSRAKISQTHKKRAPSITNSPSRATPSTSKIYEISPTESLTSSFRPIAETQSESLARVVTFLAKEIESHASPENTWSLMLELENCKSRSDFKSLANMANDRGEIKLAKVIFKSAP